MKEYFMRAEKKELANLLKNDREYLEAVLRLKLSEKAFRLAIRFIEKGCYPLTTESKPS